MIKLLKNQEFNQEVLEADGVVLVDFFATWCGPCKMLAPILEEVDDIGTGVKIMKVDIDENQELAATYGVKSVPTLKLFQGGSLLNTKVGVQSKDALLQFIGQ